MIYKIKADREAAEVLVTPAQATITTRRAVSMSADRIIRIEAVRGLRIVVNARQSKVTLPVVTTRGLKEVFAETPNPPDVSYNAINFLPDPATPDVSDMMFWEP